MSLEELKEQIQSLLGEDLIFDDDQNLFEVGLNSLQIMRLVSKWKKRGFYVTYAELMSEPYIKAWHNLLNKQKKLEEEHTIKSVRDLVEDNKTAYELTDVQYAYWIGRMEAQTLGNIGCHGYLEIVSHGLNLNMLNKAWNSLIENHPMLRTRFLKNGKQQTLEFLPLKKIEVNDFRKLDKRRITIEVRKIRERLSHRLLNIENGETIGIEVTLLPDKSIIHFDIDLLVADVYSFQIILEDLAKAYGGKNIDRGLKNWSFSKYLKYINEKELKNRAVSQKYWKDRISEIPIGTSLPTKNIEDLNNIVFCRREYFIEKYEWKKLKEKAGKNGLTIAMALLGAYATVIDRWSNESRFVINLPIFNRDSQIEGIDQVVADFTNLLLLEIDCNKDNVLSLMSSIQEQFQRDLQYISYSGVKVQRDIARLRNFKGIIAPIVFSCNLGRNLVSEEFIKRLGNIQYMITQTPQVMLDFQVFDHKDGALLIWDSVDEAFPDKMLDAMFDAFKNLIFRLVNEEEWRNINDVSIVKQENKLEQMNINCLYHDIFAVAKRFPERIAIIDRGKKDNIAITYSELLKDAGRVASLLLENGVQEGDGVALMMGRGSNAIKVILGIWTIGAYYVPVNKSMPFHRKKIILKKANVKYIMIDNNQENTQDVNVKIIHYNDVEKQKTTEMLKSYNPQNTAYVIFTSGSTGEPKGVEISHEAAGNTIQDIINKYRISDTDCLLSVSALDFDLSVFDWFGVLGQGGKVVTIRDEEWRNAHQWLEIIKKYKITIWNSVPALMKMLLIEAENYSYIGLNMRLVLLSGDWIPVDMPKKIRSHFPISKVVSLGGATEAGIWSNFYDIEEDIPDTWISIPYGKPLKNQFFRIIDNKGRDCPVWATGELWIGGRSLAKGYIGDSDLTEQRFIYDERGERWYKTGDMGRFWPDGNIQFLGRLDTQIKIRGHRIELEEIESLLQKKTFIKQCVVTSDTDNTQLIAYVVLNDDLLENEKESITAKLKQYLLEYVPDYMIPSKFIVIEQIPITANGKIDRKALSNTIVEEKRDFVFPETSTERKLADIWKRFLEKDDIDKNANYFELGGDSLIATQLTYILEKEFGVSIPLEIIFTKPVLKDMANFIDCCKSKISNSNNEVVNTEIISDIGNTFEPFPLTDVQQAYVIGKNNAYSLGSISTHYYYELERDSIDIEKLSRSLNKLVQRHLMMRAVILPDALKQKILKKVPEYKICYEILPEHTEERCKKLEEVREKLTHRKFLDGEWPLFEVFVTMWTGKARIHMCFDNTIFDGWSISLLLDEWGALYYDENTNLEELEITFRDYVLGMNHLKELEQYQKDKHYWTEKVEQMFPAPLLPINNNRRNINNRFRHFEFSIAADLWNEIKKVAEENNISSTCVILTVYAELIGRWSESSKFTLNITRFNRFPLHKQINRIIGDFTSLVMLGIDNSIGSTFLERCKKNQENLWEALEHPYYSGVEVQREYMKRNAIYKEEIMPVVFTSGLGININSANGLGKIVFNMSETPQVWMDNQIAEKDDRLFIFFDVLEGLFSETVINDMLFSYKKLLIRLATDRSSWYTASKSIVELPHISTNDNICVEYPKEDTLLSLFLKSVERYPERIAIVAEDRIITYRELLELALIVQNNILLKCSEVSREDVVAVCMEKGWEQIASALGIMLAGAAYLPLSVKLPYARRNAILMESGAKAVIIKEADLKDCYTYSFSVDFNLGKVNNIKSELTRDDLAYVIYTSGSTGTPKGVMITHGSIVNTILDLKNRFHLSEKDSTIAISDFSFDLSVFDVFGMLAYGGSIVIPSTDKILNAEYWVELIDKNKVTVWNTVPSFCEILMDLSPVVIKNKLESLRYIMLSGDWIPVALPSKIKRALPRCNVISLGGATEASIWSIYYWIKEMDSNWVSIPYGKPLGNQEIYVLNKDLVRCPVQTPGRIFIGGRGIAKGYRNNEKETNKKFYFVSSIGKRLYDTGDYGYYSDDGNIIFLGRKDTQVKINGYRIELEEIESILNRYQDIRSSVVVPNESKGYLMAAVVTKRKDKKLDICELKKYLGECLPSYMVPAVVEQLDELPMTFNNKIDRKKVGMILKRNITVDINKFENPETELEKKIAAIWSEILEISNISRNADFFRSGGDSLKAMQIINRIKESAIGEVSLSVLFNHATIKELGEFISSQKKNYQEGTI